MVDEERKLQKKEILRLESEVQIACQGNET